MPEYPLGRLEVFPLKNKVLEFNDRLAVKIPKEKVASFITWFYLQKSLAPSPEIYLRPKTVKNANIFCITFLPSKFLEYCQETKDFIKTFVEWCRKNHLKITGKKNWEKHGVLL